MLSSGGGLDERHRFGRGAGAESRSDQLAESRVVLDRVGQIGVVGEVTSQLFADLDGVDAKWPVAWRNLGAQDLDELTIGDRSNAAMPSAVQPTEPTASAFAARLRAMRGRAAAEGSASGRVPMRDIFALAKTFIEMPPTQIELLLDRSNHDARVGAVAIMDWQARRKSTSPERRRELFELYLRRHDRIDTWDLVDRAAPYVVGGYLADKPRDPLYVLARSRYWWERRTAIVSTYFFVRRDELADTFAIADLLADDPHDLVQKAVGGWVREAGKRDRQRLLDYLDRHAATMPRTALRYAIEHLEPETRQHYLQLGKQAR